MLNESPDEAREAPLNNPLERLLGYQLRRASQMMLDDLVTALQDLELRPTNASVLLLIASNPGVTQSRIGQALAIERANMAPMTAKLIERGLIRRSRADGRSHGLHLTEQGTKVAATVRRRIAEHEERFWKAMKPRDRTVRLAFLRSIWD